MESFKKSYLDCEKLDIRKLGVTLEELRKIKTIHKSSHSILNNTSEEIITHSKAKHCL